MAPMLVVLLPLVAGIALNWLPRDGAIGPFSTALGPTGALTTVGLMLICVGAQITPGQLGRLGWRTALILVACTLVPALLVVLYVHRFGPGGVLGISGLACASCLCTSNAVWLALARRHGSLIDQWSGTVAAAFNAGPVVPLLLLVAVAHGLSGPWWAASLPSVLDALLPLALGFAAGLVARAAGRDLAPKLRPAIPYLMVVFCVQLGARIRPGVLAAQAPRGALLGAVVVVLTGGLVVAGYAAMRRRAVVGWAAGAIAVGAPISPAVVAASLPAWLPFSAAATAQLGVAVIVSTVLASALCALAARLSPRQVAAAPPVVQDPLPAMPPEPRVVLPR